jgi:hypothetical protein
MARSEEAILRRALKRNRSEGEQRHADRIEMKRQALKLEKKIRTVPESNKRPRLANSPTTNSSAGLNDPSFRQGSHRTGPSNNGRASSDTRRRNPSSPRRTTKAKPSRHDEETSKKLKWARQADSNTLSKNQELRERYRQTNGEGMDANDLERAKLLIARDQRKQERKNKKKNAKADPTNTKTEQPIVPSGETKNEDKPSTPKIEHTAQEAVVAQQQESRTSKSKKGKKSSEDQSKRDSNKALRLQYRKTGGKGMKEEQIERAKLLIARDEKKKKRRAQMEAGKKQ